MAVSLLLIASTLLITTCQSQCNANVETTKKKRDRRADKNKLRIVTYNAEWLYQDNCADIAYLKKMIPISDFPIWDQTNKEDPSNPDDWKKIDCFMQTHMRNVAEYLDTVNADIFVIQEVCDCDTLDATRNLMKNKADYRAYLTPNTKGKMQTGIITKIDPVPEMSGKAKVELIATPPDAVDMKKDRVFRATFDIGDAHQLVLYGAHLTATESESSINSREKQSTKLNTAAAASISPNHFVVVTGDLNTQTGYHYYETQKVSLSGNKAKMRQYYTDLNTNKNIFAGYKLKDGTKSMEVTEDDNPIKKGNKLFQIQVKQTSSPGKGIITDGIINCGGKKLADLLVEFKKVYDELNDGKYNGKNFAMTILFTTDVKHDEETLTNLAKNDFSQVQANAWYNVFAKSGVSTSAISGDVYSHWDCAGKKKDGVLDYFFFSKSVKDKLSPKLIYHHEKYYIYQYYFFVYQSYERICSGHSDHSPVELSLDTSAKDIKYAAHDQYYGDYYNEQRAHHHGVHGRDHLMDVDSVNSMVVNKDASDSLYISLLYVLISAMIFCICCMVGMCMCFGAGLHHYYHKMQTKRAIKQDNIL